MKKLLYLLLAITVACSSGDDSSDNNNPPANCDVVYLDANGVTIKACPDAQIGDTGNVNGFTYTIVSGQQLIEYVNSGYPELNRLVTTHVTNMELMFFSADAFNQPIGNWDVSNVTNMDNMFMRADAFNQPIGKWDVSNVTNMSGMFSNADAFNQPIGEWNTSSVTRMPDMFYDADAFNQDLNFWNVINVEECYGFSQVTPQWTLPKPNFTNCTP